MANTSVYKQYSRQQRRAVLESDFSHGMMSSKGVVDDGYLKSLVNCAFDKETSSITPRPGLRVSGVIFPEDTSVQSETFINSELTIKAVKQCVENGVTYQQIIVGELDEEDPTKGLIWVLTSSAFAEHTPVKFTDDYTGAVDFSNYVFPSEPKVCKFYTVQSPSIHDIFLTEDTYKRIEFPVGCFAYGNHFYFFGEDGLYRTTFNESLIQPMYVFEKVTAKELSVSEAVTFGYNMLLGDPGVYTFMNKHQAPGVQFEGILPYVSDSTHSHSELMMTPKKNQPVDLVCYYDSDGNTTYNIVWESRELNASDWTELKRQSNVTLGPGTEITLDGFRAQDREVMVRVSAYTVGADTIEKAMVVGFDFTEANYGSARSLQQTYYDLTTATGMENWNGRIAAWGLPKDPTILFISDYEEPSYFAYPNNIIVFDEPIIYAVGFMGNLVVFTTDKMYQVTANADASGWTTTVLQSHLSIDPWDKHLIQTVRNMLFFKSGNYYYMMVPKAQSLTGELVLAPITTPITSFFDNFSVNVQEILEYTYDYRGHYELLTYYNLLDYEDVHNIYAYRFDESRAILHFDVIYNTVDRTWRVWVFEAPNLIYPFKQEATRTGLLATTSLVSYKDISDSYASKPSRIVQVFSWDKMLVRGCYIPSGTEVLYDPDGAAADTEEYSLHINPSIAHVEGTKLVFESELYAYVDEGVLHLQNASDFYAGYSKTNVLQTIKYVFDNQDKYYTFRNYQFIDTGYRDDELHLKKRYREIQLQLNNLDKKNLEFGMDYVLDGAPRGIYYKYETTQIIDEFDPDYGVVYIESTPYMEVELDHIDQVNQWILDQDLMPEVALWKIRVSISGKGYAPRLRLYSRNEKRYELLGINWISKMMNMR